MQKDIEEERKREKNQDNCSDIHIDILKKPGFLLRVNVRKEIFSYGVDYDYIMYTVTRVSPSIQYQKQWTKRKFNNKKITSNEKGAKPSLLKFFAQRGEYVNVVSRVQLAMCVCNFPHRHAVSISGHTMLNSNQLSIVYAFVQNGMNGASVNLHASIRNVA
jgi:hypothetical protein